jgi:serine/threonine protein kinase
VTLLKKLNHPFIPKCHKLLKTTNNMYLIFDRLAGTTLARFISNDLPAITWENQLKSCLRIAEELCSVLGYLADRKISHSFINFDHVLIDKEGLSKVIHFSCAEELKGDEKSIEELHKNRTNDICNAP